MAGPIQELSGNPGERNSPFNVKDVKVSAFLVVPREPMPTVPVLFTSLAEAQ